MTLTNLGNSKAGVVDAIHAAERIDWLLGLKQAENIILSQKTALRSNFWDGRKILREINLKREKIVWLKRLYHFLKLVPILGTIINNSIDTLSDEILAWEEQQGDRQALFRDCEYELNVAIQEKERIIKEHPEILGVSYEQLQQRTLLAIKEKKLSYLLPRYWSAKNGLPESVGVTLFECDEEERDYLISGIAQRLYALPVTEETIRVAGAISKLPVHQQQALLNSQLNV